MHRYAEHLTPRPMRLPISNAVRAAVVTHIPSTRLRLADPRCHRYARRASAVAACLCGSIRREGPALSTSRPTSQRPTTRRSHRVDATTATLPAIAGLPTAQHPAVRARRDIPACTADAIPEPTTFRLRRLPSLETASPIPPPWPEPAKDLRQHRRLCRFVRNCSVLRTTPHSRGHPPIKRCVANVTYVTVGACQL